MFFNNTQLKIINIALKCIHDSKQDGCKSSDWRLILELIGSIVYISQIIINIFIEMEKKEGYTVFSGEYKGPKGDKAIHLAEKQGK